MLPVLLAVLFAAAAQPAISQTATLRGFVTDAADGRALAGATVALYLAESEAEAAVPRYGAVTDIDGVYLIRSIQAGAYALRISFVGYETYTDTLNVEAGDALTASVALPFATEALGEVIVEEEDGGMANVDAGQQTIRPEDIERVPSPDISSDLATYLTTLPGVVTTGDQGGQFFVRGGEPTQNLVMIDGMHVYQPFHLLGYYSVFPADVLNRVDFYAGGYPSRYGTRLSSVIDASTRNGNNRRFEGMASVSPFTGAARLEGPLVPGRVSFLATGRESLIERGAARYLDQDLPFRFGDAYAKVHARITPRHEISVTALRSHERGTIGERTGGAPASGERTAAEHMAGRAPEDITWRNEAIGLRGLLLPRLYPVVTEVYVSHSRLTSMLGPSGDPVRSSSVRSTRVALDAYFPGDRTNVHAGWEAVFTYLDSELGGLYQNVSDEHSFTVPGAFYGEWETWLRPNLRLQAGSRFQFFTVRLDPYFEPRVRMSWEHGIHRISAAAGIYQQELVGVSDRRDAASVFTAWTSIRRDRGRIPYVRFQDADDPRRSRVVFTRNLLANRIGRAYHGILGYRGRPADGLEVSVEGFYKEVSNLFVAEWTALPNLSTRLHPAKGRSGGMEVRAEVRRGLVYASVNYGLSSTVYRATAPAIEVWYGSEQIRFRPAHDRRHQIDALVSLSVAGFELNMRWAFGSGFPYTRPRSYDGFAPIDGTHDVFSLPRFRRVLYEHPNRGRMPAYHRLDVSLERTFDLPGAALTLQGSVINVYDRRNVFYYDTFTLERVNQLPVIPSAGLRLVVE